MLDYFGIDSPALLGKGRALETILRTEQGVASCGSGSHPLPRGGRKAASRALRPGREELAGTDPDASPVREARHRSPKPPRWKRREAGGSRYVAQGAAPR